MRVPAARCAAAGGVMSAAWLVLLLLASVTASWWLPYQVDAQDPAHTPGRPFKQPLARHRRARPRRGVPHRGGQLDLGGPLRCSRSSSPSASASRWRWAAAEHGRWVEHGFSRFAETAARAAVHRHPARLRRRRRRAPLGDHDGARRTAERAGVPDLPRPGAVAAHPAVRRRGAGQRRVLAAGQPQARACPPWRPRSRCRRHSCSRSACSSRPAWRSWASGPSVAVAPAGGGLIAAASQHVYDDPVADGADRRSCWPSPSSPPTGLAERRRRRGRGGARPVTARHRKPRTIVRAASAGNARCRRHAARRAGPYRRGGRVQAAPALVTGVSFALPPGTVLGLGGRVRLRQDDDRPRAARAAARGRRGHRRVGVVRRP